MTFSKLGTQGKLPRVIKWYIYKHVEAQSDEFLCDFFISSLCLLQGKVLLFILFNLYEIDFGLNSGCVHF